MDNESRQVIKHLASFQLTTGCLLHLGSGSLTWFEGDAIINAADEGLLGGYGGVDAAVHRAAGPDLRKACDELPAETGVRCPTGEARLTRGFKLLAKHVIHAVGPRFESDAASAPLLASAYRSALSLANSQRRIRTIAIPAISCGLLGYPATAAAVVALKACAAHAGRLSEITFVFFDTSTSQAFLRQARATLSPFPPREPPSPRPAAAAAAAAAATAAVQAPPPPLPPIAAPERAPVLAHGPDLVLTAERHSLERMSTADTGGASISQQASFHLGGGCLLFLGMGDLTCFAGDAVVNSANEEMRVNGDLFAALADAAGPDLLTAFQQLPTRHGAICPAGEACVTPGFGLPAKQVIHAVAPQYDPAGTATPLLAATYRSALAAAKDRQHGIRTVAFPALGCGQREFPVWDVAAIALDACAAYAVGLESVSFVFQDEEAAQPFFFQAAAMFPTVGRQPSLARNASLHLPADTAAAHSQPPAAARLFSQDSFGGSVKTRQPPLRQRGDDSAPPALDTLHVHSAAGSAMIMDDAAQTAHAARSESGNRFQPDMHALEARHDSLFNQATQMDTLADSHAFETLPLAPAQAPRDPGSHATPRERLDYIQQQLDAFGPRGQAVVQFVCAPKTNAQFAIKFFSSRAAYTAERRLFEVADLREFMPPVVEFVENEDGTIVDPFDNPMPPCFVMEKGEVLPERTARCKHDFFTTIQIIGQVARCLSELHSRGWVHRDLKPGNIIFLPSAGSWTLIDFGLAARAGQPAPRGHTPGYTAPEIVAAHEAGTAPPPADPATDAWALGVMAFELLTGHPAFNFLNGSKEAYAQLRGDALLPWEGDRLTDAVRQKLGVLRTPILQTLSRDAAARPPCSVFCDRLRAAFSADTGSLKLG
eukprot:jgi/Ulvmu1/6426/UM003_0055.1